MKISICFVSFLFSLNALCQNTYVVTNRLDTIYGNIEFSDFKDEIFINTEKDQFTLKPYQISKVSIEDKVYKSIQYNQTIELARVIIEGRLNLYQIREDGSHEFSEGLLIKENGDYLTVPNLGFKKIVSNFLSDCIALSQEIKDGNLKRINLDEIVKEYNTNCEGIESGQLKNFNDLLSIIYSKLEKEERITPNLKKALLEYENCEFNTLIKDLLKKMEE